LLVLYAAKKPADKPPEKKDEPAKDKCSEGFIRRGSRAMPSWLLLTLIFFAWCLWAAAAIVQKRLDGARRGLSPDKRGGVSVMPVIPIFPLLAWGAALLVDRFADPWGKWSFATLHAIYAIVLAGSIIRDLNSLRRID
jgi:hypothetical protein